MQTKQQKQQFHIWGVINEDSKLVGFAETRQQARLMRDNGERVVKLVPERFQRRQSTP